MMSIFFEEIKSLKADVLFWSDLSFDKQALMLLAEEPGLLQFNDNIM